MENNTIETKGTIIKKIIITGLLFISIGGGIFGAGCGGYILDISKNYYLIVKITGIIITIWLGIVFWRKFSWNGFKSNFKFFGILGKIIYLLFILLCIVAGLTLAFCGGLGLFN